MVRIKKGFLDEIRKQGEDEWPHEACGYLIGRDFSSLDQRIPMTNIDQSPEHFSFDPQEQFKALEFTRQVGKELLAVYHTHPETPARMSDEDIRLAHDTRVVYFIYSQQDRLLKAFRIDRDKNVQEIEYVFYD